jgi:predicted dehydrogenase
VASIIGPGTLPLRGALLGTGSISVHHMQAWQAIPGVKIVAMANRTRSRAESLARQFGVDDDHIYDDYRRLLDSERLDFVDIATAPDIHREQVLAAAAHGVHILCQKPVAVSLGEAREMIGACEAAGVRFVVNENWRWRRWYRELKQRIDAGQIGAPRYARFAMHNDEVWPAASGCELLRRQPYTAHLPNLILYELGIHFVDVLRYLLGDVESVYARLSRVSPLVQGEDMAIVLLEFRSGATGLIDISWGSHVPSEKRLARGSLDTFIVEGEQGTLELDPYQEDSISMTTANHTKRWAARPDLTRAAIYQESYNNTQNHFIQCLRSGEPAENEARDNLKTFAATIAAYASAARKRVITVEEFCHEQ